MTLSPGSFVWHVCSSTWSHCSLSLLSKNDLLIPSFLILPFLQFFHFVMILSKPSEKFIEISIFKYIEKLRIPALCTPMDTTFNIWANSDLSEGLGNDGTNEVSWWQKNNFSVTLIFYDLKIFCTKIFYCK